MLRSCPETIGDTMPSQLADIEKAVLLKDDAVAAASRSIAASHRAETSSLPLSRSVLADIDGPDPALWRLRNGHEAVGVSERIESWAWTEDGNDRSFPTTVVQRGFVSKLEPAVEGARDVAKRTGSEAEWPRGVRLRTRLGKRCRKDLAAGRAGILIKATFNPLEGDSSGAKVSIRHKDNLCLLSRCPVDLPLESWFPDDRLRNRRALCP